MRRGGKSLLVLILLLAGGCLTPEPTRSSSWLKKFSSASLALGGDKVLMDIALLERSEGDPYLNHDLWLSTDEQIVPLEQKARLEDNGFRVGQIVGTTPAALQTLLTSERCCVNPRRRLVQSGYTASQLLGPIRAECRYQVQEDGPTAEITLGNAQFLLDVMPALTSDGRTRLRFTPRVEFGEALPNFRPAPDRSGWTLQLERPSKNYPQLSWEVVLRPNEYLVIGARPDKPLSLGQQAFVQTQGSQAVQRLLVIRTSRPPRGSDADDEPTLEDLARAGPSPPLALQATMTAVRANGL